MAWGRISRLKVASSSVLPVAPVFDWRPPVRDAALLPEASPPNDRCARWRGAVRAKVPGANRPVASQCCCGSPRRPSTNFASPPASRARPSPTLRKNVWPPYESATTIGRSVGSAQGFGTAQEPIRGRAEAELILQGQPADRGSIRLRRTEAGFSTCRFERNRIRRSQQRAMTIIVSSTAAISGLTPQTIPSKHAEVADQGRAFRSHSPLQTLMNAK